MKDKIGALNDPGHYKKAFGAFAFGFLGAVGTGLQAGQEFGWKLIGAGLVAGTTSAFAVWGLTNDARKKS